jgi:hypothetical protein
MSQSPQPPKPELVPYLTQEGWRAGPDIHFKTMADWDAYQASQPKPEVYYWSPSDVEPSLWQQIKAFFS